MAVQVMNTPDPSVAKGLKIAQDTLDATRKGVGWAIAAAIAAILALCSSIADNWMNRIQLAEAFRRPKLALENVRTVLQQAEQRTTDAGKTFFYAYHQSATSFNVTNTGTRAAQGYQLEVWIPISCLNFEMESYDGIQEFDGKDHKRYTMVSDRKVYPNASPDSVHSYPRLLSQTPYVDYYWRISDDFQQYPTDGYGKGRFVFWAPSSP
jgi:hypothetical protein